MLLFLCIGIFSPGKYKVEKIPEQQFITFEDGKIRFQISANQEHSILLLHGFNGSMNQWNSLWPQLQSCSRSIVRIDIPGFGESEWQTDDYSLNTQAKRLIALMDFLKIKTVTLVGTSMGGSLGGWMAAEYPTRVTELIMVAPSGYPGSLNAGIVGSVVYRPGWINSLFSKISATAAYKYMFPDSRAQQALSVTASYGDSWVKALARIKQQTIILWSKTDTRVSFRNAVNIQKLITNSKVVVASNEAGHNISGLDSKLLAEQICTIQSIRAKNK